MWSLYDKLIEEIPDTLAVTDFIEGPFWVAVKSNAGGVGLAMKVLLETREPQFKRIERGMKLRDAGAACKSWNLLEASFGIAALNAFYNEPRRAEKLGLDITAPNRKHDAFKLYREAITGKKVAVIGHFPNLETELAPICSLSILERNPQPGDFPDSACEYILSEQDFVFITGVTLVNKTLPRLLELSKRAFVIMAGPSVPLCAPLFDFGVNNLSGYVVLDSARCFDLVSKGHLMKTFDAGTMVSYEMRGQAIGGAG